MAHHTRTWALCAFGCARRGCEATGDYDRCTQTDARNDDQGGDYKRPASTILVPYGVAYTR